MRDSPDKHDIKTNMTMLFVSILRKFIPQILNSALELSDQTPLHAGDFIQLDGKRGWVFNLFQIIICFYAPGQAPLYSIYSSHY
jgi:hypothetical protein